MALRESLYMSAEGDEYLMVCAEINEVPFGGLECDISISLQAIDGTAGKLCIS